MPSLSTLLDSADFGALNLCRDRDGAWQASVPVGSGVFRVRIAESASEAVLQVLSIGRPAELPPPPY